MASTIQVDKITDIGGNTIISSNGSGTFTSNLPSNVSSATGTLPIANGGTGATTLAAAGLANTPRFSVYLDATQAAPQNTWTKIVFNDEDYDSDSAFDTSNGRFTVPSGKAGVYVFTFAAQAPDMPDNTSVACRFYINGSPNVTIGGTVRYQGWTQGFTGVGSTSNNNITGIAQVDLSVGDYVELYIRQNRGTSANLDIETQNFAGYKLL